MSRIAFADLSSADLVVDATYESDRAHSHMGSEPLGRLTGTGNQGGFRFSGTIASPRVVVLYTTMDEPNWPDEIDAENGLFVYFGDNRTPGSQLHAREKSRGGNTILSNAFELSHAGPEGRAKVPPFLIFSRGGKGRDAVFRGLAVPGAAHLDQSADLVAIWKSAGGQRFQNYRSVFTILDLQVVRREWLDELKAGEKLGAHCPEAWRQWVETGKPKALKAERITRTRTSAQQMGPTPAHRAIAAAIHEHFSAAPVGFEHFAADLVCWMDPNVVRIEVTRPSRDGGRDAVGLYKIGMPENCVTVDFAVEAKCHAPDGGGLGVKVASRLISRLRHRQFGVLVTTSYLAQQAYDEIIEDQHPVVICSGGDVAQLLMTKRGLHTADDVAAWLREAYPIGVERKD
jgi:hypothetical protein